MHHFDIYFHNDCAEEMGVLSLADMSADYFDSDILSPIELEISQTMGAEKRQREFLFGRIIAKHGLKKLCNLQSNSIDIIKEENGRPIIKNSDYAVTISHTKNIIISFVFHKKNIFGIDVEMVRLNKMHTIKRILSDSESSHDDIQTLTAIWTLKESLSKAIGCGFTVPFENFEISNLKKDGHIIQCSYNKHKNFCGLAICNEKISFAFSFLGSYKINMNHIKQLMKSNIFSSFGGT